MKEDSNVFLNRKKNISEINKEKEKKINKKHNKKQKQDSSNIKKNKDDELVSILQKDFKNLNLGCINLINFNINPNKEITENKIEEVNNSFHLKNPIKYQNIKFEDNYISSEIDSKGIISINLKNINTIYMQYRVIEDCIISFDFNYENNISDQFFEIQLLQFSKLNIMYINNNKITINVNDINFKVINCREICKQKKLQIYIFTFYLFIKSGKLKEIGINVTFID